MTDVILAVLAAAVCVLAGLHLLGRLILFLCRDSHYNRNLYFTQGQPVDGETGGGRRLLEQGQDANTVMRPREHVTSDFSSIYVRLRREDTGESYDAYLVDRLVVGRNMQGGSVEGLLLDDPMVSKKHCLIYRKGDRIMIQDLGSTNHTFINGFLAEEAMPLSHGDDIRLGKSTYQFLCYYAHETG